MRILYLAMALSPYLAFGLFLALHPDARRFGYGSGADQLAIITLHVMSAVCLPLS